MVFSRNQSNINRILKVLSILDEYRYKSQVSIQFGNSFKITDDKATRVQKFKVDRSQIDRCFEVDDAD